VVHGTPICPSLLCVPVVLAVAFLLLIVPLGLAMCRLAAHSDEAQAVAIAEWLASHGVDYRGELPVSSRERSQPGGARGARRAAG